MKKRIWAILLSLIVTMPNLVSCYDKKNTKVITADTPYYSVVIGSSNKEKNAYTNLDVEFPKITYSNDDGSELIDPINAEIEKDLSALVETAKENALSTYKTYLVSAKENAKNDLEDKIANLEKKYEGIIDEDGNELISDLKARINEGDIPNKTDAQKRNDNNIEDSNKVNGFTSTEDIVIPGLHNKNIIVVETTAKPEHETTASNFNQRPSSGSFGNNGRQNRASWSNGMPKDDFNSNDNRKIKATEETTKIETNVKETTIDNEPEITTVVASESEVTPLSLEDFYAEYRKLERTRIPDDFTLTRQYIPTTINCGFQVKCLDEDYLSLFIELTESRTTSTVKRLFYNIDLNNKKIVNINDILGDKYKETCISNINTAIEKWSDEQKSTLLDNYSLDNYINENTPFFINNNHKPVIQIEKFVITIGSAGYHEFQIP